MNRAAVFVAAAVTVLLLVVASLPSALPTVVSAWEFYGTALLPALLILATTLLLYDRVRQAERRKEAAVRAAKVDTSAQDAREHAAALTALVELSQRFNGCKDGEALREAVLADVPRVIDEQQFWLTASVGDYEFVVGPPKAAEWPVSDANVPEAWDTFPLMAGDENIGVLGVRQRATPLPEYRRRTIELTALILAGSIKNVQLFTRIRDFSMFDPLTGCLTQAQGLERLSAEMRRAQRSGSPLCVVMIAPDNFAALVKEHGQAVADQALARLGHVLKRHMRASDTRCRYQGEEFLMVLPETPLAGAVNAATNMRQTIRDIRMAADGEHIDLSAGIGIAEVLPTDGSAMEPLGRVRYALKTAQGQGLGRVFVARARPSEMNMTNAS